MDSVYALSLITLDAIKFSHPRPHSYSAHSRRRFRGSICISYVKSTRCPNGYSVILKTPFRRTADDNTAP